MHIIIDFFSYAYSGCNFEIKCRPLIDLDWLVQRHKVYKIAIELITLRCTYVMLISTISVLSFYVKIDFEFMFVKSELKKISWYVHASCVQVTLLFLNLFLLLIVWINSLHKAFIWQSTKKQAI